jgi:8-oxo-dGTP pyrophosphatase MutT (NUDIX family)
MKSREGVALILINNSGQIALQLRDDVPDTWGLFGGWMEANETPESAAQRELEEELSVRLAPEQFVFAGTHENPGRYFAYIFRVTLKDELVNAVLHEGLAWGCFSQDALKEMQILAHHREMLLLFG